MSDHSLLSASAADRWTKCPISLTATDESRTSEAAAEGTVLHGISESVLRGAVYPAVGSTHSADGFDFEYTEDRHADVQAYVDYVRSLPWVGSYNVEARIHYGRTLGTPHNLTFGTADCYGFTEDLEGRVLRIIDLKMGRKPVNPDRNPQAILYAAGVLESLHPILLPRAFPVEITIFQPRLSRKPFTWATTVGYVEDAAAAMRPAAQAGVRFANKTPLPEDVSLWPELPGSHCHYCRRKNQCGEFQRSLMVIAQPGATVTWNPVVFAMRDSIKTYIDELEQLAYDEAMLGNALAGTKLVKGRAGHAKLIATEAAVEAKAESLGIKAAVVEVKKVFATPSKIRDAFKKAGVDAETLKAFIHQPEAKLQIADAADPRPAATVATENSFVGVAR